jgi:hypothetical protein
LLSFFPVEKIKIIQKNKNGLLGTKEPSNKASKQASKQQGTAAIAQAGNAKRE